MADNRKTGPGTAGKARRTAKATSAAKESPARPVRAAVSKPLKENAALDDALFVPRLDRLALSLESMEGAGPNYQEIFESICGVADDSQEVEQYDGTLGVSTAFVNQREPMVAQVQWNAGLGAVYTNPGNVSGVRWGTGTMIGPDLFLTCGHLFDPAPNGWTIPRQNGTSTAISPQEAATNMHLNFNYQLDPSGVLQAEESFAITQLIEYRLGGLDMALCRIAGSPGNTYGWSEFATTNAVVGDMLAIIGHPAGQPKRIEAGPLTQITGSVVRYNDIDTLGGNSGSGILHSPSGRIVGVHTNGGCNFQGTGSNSGVAIAAIVAASPTLQATTPSSSTGRTGDLVLTTTAADLYHTSFAADFGTVNSWDTAKAADTGIVDSIGTRLNADFPGTGFAFDTGAQDHVGTFAAGDVGTWGTGDDPLTMQETVFNPGDLLRDPVIYRRAALAAAGGLRPFVQAGPAMQVPGVENVSDDGSLLDELAQIIAQQTQLLAALQALYGAVSGGEGQSG